MRLGRKREAKNGGGETVERIRGTKWNDKRRLLQVIHSFLPRSSMLDPR
jgi:hypothetical protein